jgi:rhomboid protease GluP
MQIKYNAPVTLSYAILSTLVVGLSFAIPGISSALATPGYLGMHWNQVTDYLRFFTYTFDHAGLDHLLGNFAIILLVGPQIELAYGGRNLGIMMLIASLVTALINAVFLPSGIMGASGIAFMMIILASFTNVSKGEIPLTFLLVIAIYLGKEIYAAVTVRDNISQFAHIAGGIIGSVFGFLQPARSGASS